MLEPGSAAGHEGLPSVQLPEPRLRCLLPAHAAPSPQALLQAGHLSGRVCSWHRCPRRGLLSALGCARACDRHVSGGALPPLARLGAKPAAYTDPKPGAAGALAGLALPGLTVLALDGVACAGPGAPGAFAFGALAHLTRLAELRLTRQLTVAVNPAGAAPPGCLAALAGLGRLSALRLDRAGGLAGAAALGGSLTRLRLLLRGPPAEPGATLAGLAALPRLRELDVDLRMHARAGRAGGPGRRGAGPPAHLAPVAALRQLRMVRRPAPLCAARHGRRLRPRSGACLQPPWDRLHALRRGWRGATDRRAR